MRDRSVGWDGGIVAYANKLSRTKLNAMHDWHIARSIPETAWPMHIKEQTPMTDMAATAEPDRVHRDQTSDAAACCRDERRIIIV